MFSGAKCVCTCIGIPKRPFESCGFHLGWPGCAGNVGAPLRAVTCWASMQRTWQIWSFAFVFAVKSLALNWRITYGRKGMTEEHKKERRVRLAGWLREGLIKLGPTFIKIGQQFSTRVDVLSREFIAELEKVLGPPTVPGATMHACTARMFGQRDGGMGGGGGGGARVESDLVMRLLTLNVVVPALSYIMP